jgi:hypothetical protein
MKMILKLPGISCRLKFKKKKHWSQIINNADFGSRIGTKLEIMIQ